MTSKTKQQLEAELNDALARAIRAERNQGPTVQNCVVGSLSDLHAEAIMKLADAAMENAKAINAIASKARVEIHGNGIQIG